MEGNLEAVKFLVEECEADINAVQEDGLSCVDLATGREVTRYLVVEKKADLPPPDIDNVTLLQKACRRLDVGKVKFLLETFPASYLQINHCNKMGETALHITLGEMDGQAFQNGREIIQSLLAKGASADLMNRHGVSPLTLVKNCSVDDAEVRSRMQDIHKLLTDSISGKYSQHAAQTPVSHLVSWFKKGR